MVWVLQALTSVLASFITHVHKLISLKLGFKEWPLWGWGFCLGINNLVDNRAGSLHLVLPGSGPVPTPSLLGQLKAGGQTVSRDNIPESDDKSWKSRSPLFSSQDGQTEMKYKLRCTSRRGPWSQRLWWLSYRGRQRWSQGTAGTRTGQRLQREAIRVSPGSGMSERQAVQSVLQLHLPAKKTQAEDRDTTADATHKYQN